MKVLLWVWAIVFATLSAHAAPPPHLAKPAKRIITLAPHLTELAYSVGAGDAIVGVGRYSNYPVAALKKPIVGDAFSLSLESIIKLKPDLVLAWQGGGRPADLARLRQLGVVVWEVKIERLNDIPLVLAQIGQLTGRTGIAQQQVWQFNARLKKLKQTRKGPPKVFLQIGQAPLYTIGKSQILHEVITLCGGQNIFAHLSQAAPQVSLEAVIKAKPDVIVFLGNTQAAQDRQPWLRWQTIPAVKANRFVGLDADSASRPSVRILDAAAQLCQAMP